MRWLTPNAPEMAQSPLHRVNGGARVEPQTRSTLAARQAATPDANGRHHTRWSGRGAAFLGDRRRFSSRHRALGLSSRTTTATLPPSPSALAAACWGLCAVGACLTLLTPVEAFASSAPPEIFVAVDTSESMQYVVGHDTAPDCTQPIPARTRWLATLEMLLGAHDSFGCAPEALADHPDAVTPPKQIFGDKACIGGVPMVVSHDAPIGVSASDSQPLGDRSWAGAAPTGNNGLVLETTDTDARLPYFVLDTKTVVSTELWVGGKITVTTKDGNGAGAIDRYAVLIHSPIPPSQLSSKEWVCKTNDAKRVAVSQPVKLATVAGGKTVFHLTQAFASELMSAHKAGQTTFTVAIAPAANWMSESCSARAGDTAVKFKIQFSGPQDGAVSLPQFAISPGKVCAREGPGKHFAPIGDRVSNGLLQTYDNVAKFSLLVPDSQLGKGKDGAGGHSFGAPMGTLWGDANLGIADPFAAGSASIPVARTDLRPDRSATNNKIRAALLNLRPRGGAPIGRMVEDIRDLFALGPFQDPHFKGVVEDPINGDPYQECRERMVVLFTDGGSNLDDGINDGRQSAIAAATALNQLGVRLFVISVGDDGYGASDGPPQADRDFLDQLAFAGGTGAALRLHTTSEFDKSFKNILGSSAIVGEVRTRTLWTEATGALEDVQHTFHARSAFNSAEPIQTSGTVEQRLLSCQKQCVSSADPSKARVCTVIDYGQRLVDRTGPRRVFTTYHGKRFDFSTAEITVDALGLRTIGTAPRLRPDSTGSCVSEPNAYDLSVPEQRDAYRVDIIDLVKSKNGSCREKAVLGAPGDAQPALLEPARRLPIQDPAFKSYVNSATPQDPPFHVSNPSGSLRRPTMLFAATHDGLLHAFRTDRDPKSLLKHDLDAGDELWAWIPNFSLRRLRDLRLVTRAQESLLGGDIVAAHALLSRKVSIVADAALEWRAVVLAGAGEAGSGYFALDVTSPSEPRLLFEVTPNSHCWGPDIKLGGSSGPNCAAVSTFANLGRSTAQPVLARAFSEMDGVKAERTVVILAAGKPASASTVTNVGVDGLGKRSVFVVELASGRLLREFKDTDLDVTGVPTPVADKDHLGHFWSEPACYNTAPGALVTRCFLGDSKGMLWRMDLASSDPSKWTISFFHDAYGGPGTPAVWSRGILSGDRVPVLSAPSLANNRSGDLLVLYGTGSVDEGASAMRRHLVYSLIETFSLTSGGNSVSAIAGRNWVHALDSSTQFIGPPLVFSGDAYWASYSLSTSGLCSTGTGRLWGGDFERPLSASDPTTIFGAFPNPASPAKPSMNLTNVVVGAFQPSPVEVTTIPACINGCAPTDFNCIVAKGGALGNKPPAFQISVGTATSNQASGQAPTGGVQPKVGTAVTNLSPPRSTAVITGWDLLYD